MNRVVVTGIGAVTPLGNNVTAFWQGLIAGRSGAAGITKFDASKFKTRFACEVKDFSVDGILPTGEIRKYDLFTLYAIVAAEEAVRQSGLDLQAINKQRAGVIWGAGEGGIITFEQQIEEMLKYEGMPRFSPYFIPKRIINMAAGVISIRYGWRGINFTTAAACSAGNTAIIEAFNYIRWGKADLMITGGSEASVARSSIAGFNASKALSTLNEDPATASRPFDPGRDGFVLGEGAGAILLENYDHAIARGAIILAEIVGGGLAADAYHLTGTHPQGRGAYDGMKLALEDAGLDTTDIDYLNAHATSTQAGDISELTAIEALFGSHSMLSISSTKSMTGHLLGGAGAIEAIACIKALQEDIIPPTINTSKIEGDFNTRFHFPLGKPYPKKINYAMNNTFGFGGHVAITIFSKYNQPEQ